MGCARPRLTDTPPPVYDGPPWWLRLLFLVLCALLALAVGELSCGLLHSLAGR